MEKNGFCDEGVGLNYLFLVFLDSNFLGASFLGASSLPSRFQQGEYGHNFFRENCGKRMKSKGEKNYRNGAKMIRKV